MEPRPRQGGDRGVFLEPLFFAIGLVLVVSYRFFQPIWDVGTGLLTLGTLTGVAYLGGVVVLRRSAGRGFGRSVLIAVVASQPVLLALWALDVSVSRLVLAGELSLLLFGLVAAGVSRGPAPLRALAAFAFAALAALPTMVGRVRPDAGAVPAGPTQRYLFTSYHDLSIVTYAVIEDDLQEGGALTLLPDGRVLLVTGSGASRLLDFSDGLDASPVELGLPIDVAAYRALGRREPEFFRVFDAMYADGDLFVSLIHWDEGQDCYTLRLVEAELDGTVAGPWATRFESRPCVSLSFMGNTSGGRIAILDSSRLLLSVGSFGIAQAEDEGWGQASDYGKILELDRTTWQSRVFTSGHRNPEGLFVAGDRIWSTEHGPHGGDELNLIEAGSDYGWPYVSYGTDYGKKTLARGRTPGDHKGFSAPIYAWTPSVGISSLIRVTDGIFPMWRGDLLIGSLSGLGNGQSLFRVRLLDGRAVSIEKIQIGTRVRDLLQLPDGGPVVLWDGRGHVEVVEPADHVFSQCAACHGLRSAAHGIGPDLFGVVSNPVARHDNYDYSAALRSYGGVWTTERLDRFLEHPQLEVPGTSMEHEGVADPVERAQIIQFLGEVTAGRPVD
jgi:glucose/arabinose dehydrogenase/cytochrome c2